MDLNWFESILYGFVSGLTQLLPVSAQAHEALALKIFGGNTYALLNLFVHGGTLLAVIIRFNQYIAKLLHERNLARIPPKRRKRQPDALRVLELRFLRSAMIVMLIGMVALFLLPGWKWELSTVAAVLVINGVIVFVPGYLAQGNKDERSVSAADAMLIGIAGAAAAMPGLSGIGCVTAAGISRGISRENVLRWALLLTIPALALICAADVYSLLTGGFALSLTGIFQCLLAAVAAFGGALIGIGTMDFLAVRAGFSGFAYYCWGAALFSFIMYLTV